MAKKSMIAREDKRKKLVKKYDVKRKALKETIRDPNASIPKIKNLLIYNSKNYQGTSSVTRVRNPL